MFAYGGCEKNLEDSKVGYPPLAPDPHAVLLAISMGRSYKAMGADCQASRVAWAFLDDAGGRGQPR